MKKVIKFSVLVLAMLLVNGCANKNMEEKHSGFLKSYDGLDSHDDFENTMIRIMPGTDFTKYENIYVSPVQILSGIAEKDQTPHQKKVYKEISEYLTKGYKAEILKNGVFNLVEDKNTSKTMTFELAISAVEVHFDDIQWYQLTPITLGLTITARATYVDAAVRILAEARLSDSDNGTVLARAMDLQKGEEVKSEADELVFKDVKPALDAWLKRSTDNFGKMRQGLIKSEEK